MLDIIKNMLFAKYTPTEMRWIFLSSFTTDGQLISSHGTVETTKPMWELVELLYHALIEKEAQSTLIAVDIVLELKLETDIPHLQSLSMQEFGLCLIWEQGQSGAILPNTLGVTSVAQALWLIKQKYQLAGNATIYSFRAERMVAGK